MRFWPANYAKMALEALRIDDRPLRDEYARRAHWTIADMRDRLAEPGDQHRLTWPRFEDYRDYVLEMARATGRRGARRIWREHSEKAFRFPAISDFTVVVVESDGALTIQFWPDDPPGSSRPSRNGPPYLVRLR